jgi:hypothetical protein
MKKGTKEWLEFAKRDLEAAKILVKNEYVTNPQRSLRLERSGR